MTTATTPTGSPPPRTASSAPAPAGVTPAGSAPEPSAPSPAAPEPAAPSPAAPPPAFAAFAALRRGDAAPGWLRAPVLRAWGWQDGRTAVRLVAVSENATFRVDVDGAPAAVVRVHRPGYVADPAQIDGELTWVRAIAADTAVRVPRVVPAADGSLVQTVAHDGADWYVVAFAWVDGEVLEDALDPRPHYERIGAITADLHDHAEAWAPPQGFTRFGWALDDMLGGLARWGDWRGAAVDADGRAACEDAEVRARAVLADLPSAGPGTGLVHADLRPSNVMVDAAGDLTVIDFDDCGTSWLLWDFAAALSFIEHEPYAPEIAARWVRGYRSVRPLGEDDLERCAALSVVRRLQMLGWTTTHRADALPPAVWDAQVPGTAEVARRYAADPRWLFADL